MVQSQDLLQPSSKETIWFSEQLRQYDEADFNEYRANYSIDNVKRFAAFTCCLAGGEQSASFAWARNPDFQRLTPMVRKVRDGGHIVDIAAGFGEPSVGMLLELMTRFHLDKTKYLITDIGTQYEDAPDEADILGHMLVLNPKPIWADRPEDFYFTWSDARLDRKNWQDVRSRIIRRYGNEWDTTRSEFFQHSRRALGSDNIGLLILRHPEIGVADPHLVQIFTNIIHTMLTEATSKDIPVLITTSNNKLSQENIQKAIDTFFETQSQVTKETWEILTQETPRAVQGSVGPRILDLRMWAIFPKS